MILVDSSIWIDHLRRGDAQLTALLEASSVLCHVFIIGELACGRWPGRASLLTELARLPAAPLATHAEAMGFVDRHGLAGRGVGWLDVHLLASTALAGGAKLWTRDKRLSAVAAQLKLAPA